MNAQPHPDDLPERRGPVFHFTITDELTEVFRHMQAYAGTPLTSRDVADELGIDRTVVARDLITLVRLDYVGTRQGNGRLLYYWKEPA